MGIVNVTPDSFSDGGRFLDAAAAVAHGLRLRADGAGRPMASPIQRAVAIRASRS